MKGSLTRSFSTVSYFKDIDTLADLDRSGLLIGTSSGSLKGIFVGVNTSNSVIRSLSVKYRLLYNVTKSTILRTAYDRDICCVERWSDIGVIIPVSDNAKRKVNESIVERDLSIDFRLSTSCQMARSCCTWSESARDRITCLSS